MGQMSILIQALIDPASSSKFQSQIQEMAKNVNAEVNIQVNTSTTDATIDQFITRTQNKIQNLQSRNNKIFDDPAVQAEVTKVQGMLDSLKMNPETFTTASKVINTEMDSTRTAFNSVSSASENFGSSLVADSLKFGIWMMAASALMIPLNSIKTGISSIISMNDSLTMTAEAMNTSVSNLGQLASGSQQIAENMGSNLNDVLAIAHVYANVNETQASILAQTKATVELSNISGLDGNSATNAMQAIEQAWNMGADQLQHVDDVMATIASNLKENYQTAIDFCGIAA
jgi:hypothetical protein